MQVDDATLVPRVFVGVEFVKRAGQAAALEEAGEGEAGGAGADDGDFGGWHVSIFSAGNCLDFQMSVYVVNC